MATVLNDYVLTRPLTEVIPGIADVCEMKEIKSIIEDTPMEVEVTKDSFTEAVEEMPRLCDEWRISRSRDLIIMMQVGTEESIKTETVPEVDIDLSSLELATTWFHCWNCTEPIGYPRVLVHGHATSFRYGSRIEASVDHFQNLGCEVWNHRGDRVWFYTQAHAAARPIIAACGLDPDVATAREMDELEPMIECLTCYNIEIRYNLDTGRHAMRWRRAVRPFAHSARCQPVTCTDSAYADPPHAHRA